MPKIICIDPGHGGYDPGCVSGNSFEKDFTLKIALHLKGLLERAGFTVVMTREADVSPGGYTEINADLNERCRIANEAHADVFLSIHVNAGGGRGAEIYTNGNGGKIKGLAESIVTNVGSIMGYHGQPVKDGGVKGTGFRVITQKGLDAKDVIDAMLVEVGFIDSDDLTKIQANVDKFAPLISKAFCQFYGVPIVEVNKVNQDQTVSDWAKASFQKAIDKGIIKGDENGNYGPQEMITKEELVVVLDRLGFLG